jgi:hypothetical protein
MWIHKLLKGHLNITLKKLTKFYYYIFQVLLAFSANNEPRYADK